MKPLRMDVSLRIRNGKHGLRSRVFCNVDCLLLVIYVFTDVRDGGGWKCLVLVFLVIGLYLIATAVWLVRQRIRFGRPTMTI